VWDCWLVDDGRDYHLFFLFASRALHDPHRRHRRASIGHAVSSDLRTWQRVADALVPADSPAFDDLATWTGSTIRSPEGTWVMYYTGASMVDGGLVQRIGIATSDDLMTWHRHPDNPVSVADGRWYERRDESIRQDEHWRDPWVFRDPDGDGWHMLLTARANHGPDDERGVIGHAHSPDMVTWTARPPLSEPGSGFGQLEVPQVEQVDGEHVLVFSCLRSEFSATRRQGPGTGGVWAARAAGPLGPYDVAAATPLTDDSLYAGRLIMDRTGQWVLIAFHHEGVEGFIGATCDPLPVQVTDKGLVLAAGAQDSWLRVPT
jgi:beta-fructofuranosidase